MSLSEQDKNINLMIVNSRSFQTNLGRFCPIVIGNFLLQPVTSVILLHDNKSRVENTNKTSENKNLKCLNIYIKKAIYSTYNVDANVNNYISQKC